MAANFDPYHTWLGIPAEDQPADYYGLLGVKRFEADANVIDNAADRQMAHLRRVRTGQHSQHAERLLNEVAKARGCLLEGAKKSAYDRQLRACAAKSSEAPLDVAPAAQAPKIVTADGIKSRTASTASPPVWLLAAGGGVAVCVVGVVVAVAAMWLSSPSNEVAESPVARRSEDLVAIDLQRHAPPSGDDAASEVTPSTSTMPQAKDSSEEGNDLEKPTVSTPVATDDASLAQTNDEKDAPATTTTESSSIPSTADPSAGIVAGVLETKRQPIAVAPQAIAFQAPDGNGRRGSNGVLLASPGGWQRHGTRWTCDYQFSGTAQGVHFIHPLGQGHVVATVYRGLKLASAVEWHYVQGQKRPFETTTDYPALSEQRDLPRCQLDSRLSADGHYSLRMNGKLLATARLDDIKTLAFDEDFTGGDGFQRQLPPGHAGVLLAPMDGGTNKAENVTLAVLSAPQVDELAMLAGDSGDVPSAAEETVVDASTGETPSGGAAKEATAPPQAASVAAKEENAESDWKPPTKNSKQMFRSFLGMYRNGFKKDVYYPVINLTVPSGNLWSQEIQEKLRGSIPFPEIGYIGMAKIMIPEDGVYVLQLANNGCKATINGKDTGGPGDVRLPRGIHSVTLAVGTHGQPYLNNAAISLKHKETGEEVPFVNSWQDILQFTSRRVAGVPVVEVTGWEPSEDKEVDVTPTRKR